MILKWSDYLKVHPSNKEYDTNASYLQQLIPIKETEANSFRLLSDNKTIVCITKDAFNGELQATFNHTIKKTSFIQENPDCLALTGFGARATTVRLDPKEIFKKIKSKVAVPTFVDMLQCQNVDEVRSLPMARNKVHLDSYAILPPTMSEELFDEENFDPAFIILKMINKIKLLDAIQRPEKIDLTSDKDEVEPEPDVEDGGNAEETMENVEKHPLEDSFGRILNFLFYAMMKTKALEPTTLMVCTKSSTTTWCEQQHSLCLQRGEEKTEKRMQPLPQDIQGRQELVDLSHNFGQLTKAMTDKTLLDIQRDVEKTNGEGKFRKLPPMMKNTIIMFTMVPEMSQDDLGEIKPTEFFLSILSMTSGTVARDTLHHIMKTKGCLVCLQDGMCAGIKNGTLQSTDIFDINGLTPFHCGPEPCGKQLTLEQRAVLEETAALGKMTKDDIALLTKSENFLARDFWAYEHQVRNFTMLCEIIGGEDCLTARAWRTVLKHARRHEATYKRMEKEHKIYYISILDELHRKTQSFIHSCAHGKKDELNLKQLDFSRIFEEVENHKYYAKRPLWLPKEQPKRKPQTGEGGGGYPGRGGPPKKRLFNGKERGDLVYNNDICEEMKVPKPDTYEKVFHPDYWRKVPACNYPDGSEKCHNWHHRGRCHSKCDRISSHSKKLTKEEIACGKEYVKKVVENYKKAQANDVGNTTGSNANENNDTTGGTGKK